MANILTFDMDLIFPETKIELDMSGASTPADMIAKIQDDLLSTRSISTFCTTTTKNTWATKKAPNKCKSKTLKKVQQPTLTQLLARHLFRERF